MGRPGESILRTIGKLKALNVVREQRPGMYGDGGGLYLQVTSGGAKSWIFRYWKSHRDPQTGALLRDPKTGRTLGRSREMGLGSSAVVTLGEARERAIECRRLIERGIDPIDARTQIAEQQALKRAKCVNFKDAAAAYMAAHRPSWKNEKHASQWSSTLETYAYPVMGSLSVQDIDTAVLIKVLEPIWQTRPETASRLRGRIESVLDWATVSSYRQGENPARWRGHLAHLLPAISKVRTIKHHAAMPYSELPGFLVELRKQPGNGARALEFLILTAARTGETIGARLQEINLQEGVWTVPAARMKAAKEHRVPLSKPALELVQSMTGTQTDEAVFPSARSNRPLSNMAMLKVLERMGRGNLTVHGFRSTFRDWAAERISFQSEVVEMALAHAVSNKVEAAYRRGDLFEKRRKLMAAWGAFCESANASMSSIVHLRAAVR